MSDVRCQRSAGLIVVIRCQLFVNRCRTEGALAAKLLAFGVHRRGHAANDLPDSVSADPGVCDSQCLGRCIGPFTIGPVHFDSIMVNRDIADHTDGQLLD